MTTILIDNNKYKFPECWDDVKYSEYVALLTLPDTLTDQIALFTQLPKQKILAIQIDVEKIWAVLSFLRTPPVFKPKPSPTVGPYRVKDSFIKIIGQFGDLQTLLRQAPSPVVTIEDNQKVADLYLEACAIYISKIKYGRYEQSKVSGVKEELKNYSSVEVLQTGGFFLFSVLKSLQPQQVN